MLALAVLEKFEACRLRLLADQELLHELSAKIQDDIERYPEDDSLIRVQLWLAHLRPFDQSKLDEYGSDVSWIIGRVGRLRNMNKIYRVK